MRWLFLRHPRGFLWMEDLEDMRRGGGGQSKVAGNGWCSGGGGGGGGQKPTQTVVVVESRWDPDLADCEALCVPLAVSGFSCALPQEICIYPGLGTLVWPGLWPLTKYKGASKNGLRQDLLVWDGFYIFRAKEVKYILLENRRAAKNCLLFDFLAKFTNAISNRTKNSIEIN